MRCSLLTGLMITSLIFLVSCGSNSKSADNNPPAQKESYLVIQKKQAVAPQYQARPVRVNCSGADQEASDLCDNALAYLQSGQEIVSTKMACAPGSPSWTMTGQIDGQKVDANFDNCNRTNQEVLKKSIVSYLENQEE